MRVVAAVTRTLTYFQSSDRAACGPLRNARILSWRNMILFGIYVNFLEGEQDRVTG